MRAGEIAWASRGWRERLTRALPWVTAAWVLVQLLSLRLGLLSAFFFDTARADVQGIDYFSLPKAWLQLRAGRSLYGTFDPPAYGPHATWFLAHPLLAVVAGWPLSGLQPMDGYGAWVVASVGVMAGCAWLLARETDDRLRRGLIWLLLLGSFPGYLLLWVGNVQALTVLGVSLLFAGMRRMTRWQRDAPWLVRLGLLVSLFTKPVVLPLLPLLLMVKETRRAAFDALAVYVPVSLLFLVVPGLNPEAVGLRRVAWLAVHPGYVRATMDVYANGLQLTPAMRDNSVHWLNLVAQSGYRLQHVDVYSLPVFLDGVLGARTPEWVYMLPTLAVLAMSAGVARVRERGLRLEAALVLAMLGSVLFLLAYPTVWEYQYTAVLPVGAMLLAMGQGRVLKKRMWAWAVGLACCAWLPGLYVLGAGMDAMRLARVGPVVGLVGVLGWGVCEVVRGPDAEEVRAVRLEVSS